MMSSPVVVKAWQKDELGNHYPCPYCEWRPDEGERLAALWLRLLVWLDERDRLPEFAWSPYCACGHSVEWCPCDFPERRQG